MGKLFLDQGYGGVEGEVNRWSVGVGASLAFGNGKTNEIISFYIRPESRSGPSHNC